MQVDSAVWSSAARLAKVVADADDSAAGLATVWAEAESIFGELIGHQLFTVLAYNADSGLVIRLYSNQPEQYPVSGTKPMGATPWGDRVLKQRLPYIGHNADDIRWAFFDHELIASMGLESTCNLPVQAFGQTLGTINLLHRADFYSEDCLAAGSVLAGLLAPIMQRVRPQ